MLQRILLLLFFCSFLNSNAFCQQIDEVRGSVHDSLGLGLPDVYITLLTSGDTLDVTTAEDGSFHFSQISSTDFTLIFTHIGYQPIVKKYSFNEGSKNIILESTIMIERSVVLEEISIKAKDPIIFKEDTIQYNAEFYRVKEGSLLEELIKKLPGIIVDSNGNIRSQGENVVSVKVNGQDFFDGALQTATRNLTVDMVENIQIINDYGDHANRTGIKTGQPIKVININLKEDKNKGLFGHLLLGGGNHQRYLTSASINSFEDKKQVSAFAGINNINADVSAGGSDNIATNTGSADGTNTTGSFGLTYRNKWGKKLSVYGNYVYSGKKNRTEGISEQRNILQDEVTVNRMKNEINSNYRRHQLQFNLEYKANKRNYFKFTPQLFFSNSNSKSFSDFTIYQENINNDSISTGSSINLSHIEPMNIGTQLFYIHNFSKEGRAVTINSNLSLDKFKQENQVVMNRFFMYGDSFDLESKINQQIVRISPEINSQTKLSYTEPLNDVSFLQLSYNNDHSTRENTVETVNFDPIINDDILVDSLSDQYNYQFTTQRMGITYQLTKLKYNFTVSLFAQSFNLNGKSISKNLKTGTSAFNIFPEARLYYTFSDGKTITLNYNVFTIQPEFNQLLPITDFTNPQYPITGNPTLNPELNHLMNLSYNHYHAVSQSTFLSTLTISNVKDKIVTNIISKPGEKTIEKKVVIQETSFINLNNYMRANGSYNYSKSFKEMKYSVSLNGNVNYTNNDSYINYERVQGNSWGLNQGLSFRMDYIDFMNSELSGNYSFNKLDYITDQSVDYEVHSLKLSATGKNYFNNLTIGYDFNKTFNRGFEVAGNPFILNLYLEYNFLKNNNGSVRLQGFDIFNQNIGINRTFSGNNIIDTNNSRLSRYFLLTFQLRIQKME